MHHLARPVEVRQVELDHLDARQRRPQCVDAGRVRSIPATDEQRLLVEPEQVTALSRRRRFERRRDRDPEPRHVAGGRAHLGPAQLLPETQHDRAAARDERRVERIDRIEIACNRLAEDDLRA